MHPQFDQILTPLMPPAACFFCHHSGEFVAYDINFTTELAHQACVDKFEAQLEADRQNEYYLDAQTDYDDSDYEAEEIPQNEY